MNPLSNILRAEVAGPGKPVDVYVFGFIEDYAWEPEDVTPASVRDLLKVSDLRAGVIVHINSPGGSVFAGLAIYEMLRSLAVPVTTRVYGLAASMASIIAIAGDRIEMAAGAYLMIHNPTTVAWGDHHKLKANAELLERLRNTLLGYYVKRTGMDEGAVIALMDKETWFTAEEAVAYGFADEVLPIERIAASLDKFSNRPAAGGGVPHTHPNPMEQPLSVIAKALGLETGVSAESIVATFHQRIEKAQQEAAATAHETGRKEGAALALTAMQVAFEPSEGESLEAAVARTAKAALEASTPSLIADQLKALAGKETPVGKDAREEAIEKLRALEAVPGGFTAMQKDKPEEFKALWKAAFGKELS